MKNPNFKSHFLYSFLNLSDAYLSPNFSNSKYLKYFITLIQYNRDFIKYFRKLKKTKKLNKKYKFFKKIKMIFKGRMASLFRLFKIKKRVLKVKTRKYV
jgi:hypothetical protein